MDNGPIKCARPEGTQEQDTSPEDRELFRNTITNLQAMGTMRRNPGTMASKPKGGGRIETGKEQRPRQRITKQQHGNNNSQVCLPIDQQLKTFRRNGVQEPVFGKWRRRHQIEDELDLHGKIRDEAKAAIERFITDSIRNGYESVRIIHGRGHRSVDGRPVLPEETRRCLQQLPSVKGYNTDAAGGSVDVWLKRQRPR